MLKALEACFHISGKFLWIVRDYLKAYNRRSEWVLLLLTLNAKTVFFEVARHTQSTGSLFSYSRVDFKDIEGLFKGPSYSWSAIRSN